MKITNLIKYGLIAASMVMAFGCGSSSGEAGNSPTTSTAGDAPKTGENSGAKKYRIGISIPAADHGWTAGVKYWAEQEIKNHPDVEWDIQTAENPDKQIQSLDAMSAKKLDALVILATESAPVTPAAKKLKEAGVFIVNVDRGFTDDKIADIFLAGDNKEFGRKSAEFIAKKLNGKGKILVLEGIACTVNTDRVEAAKAVFAKFPGIQILDSQPGEWNQEKAFNVAQALIVKHKEFDAIWAQDDDMALGVEKALKAAGRDKGVWMLGGAGMKDIVKRVMDKDPMFPADITYPPSMIAEGIKEAVKAMKDLSAEQRKTFTAKRVSIPIDLVEPTNAKDFYFPDSVY
jgi:ribose transport system substrate-binding protein